MIMMSYNKNSHHHGEVDEFSCRMHRGASSKKVSPNANVSCDILGPLSNPVQMWWGGQPDQGSIVGRNTGQNVGFRLLGPLFDYS